MRGEQSTRMNVPGFPSKIKAMRRMTGSAESLIFSLVFVLERFFEKKHRFPLVRVCREGKQPSILDAFQFKFVQFRLDYKLAIRGIRVFVIVILMIVFRPVEILEKDDFCNDGALEQVLGNCS